MATELIQGPAKLHRAPGKCMESTQCVYTELLPCGLQGLRMGIPTDLLPHVNLKVRKEIQGGYLCTMLPSLWVLSSSRHSSSFISLHFHNKPMRITGSMILLVRKLRLREVTCLKKTCLTEGEKNGKKKRKKKEKSLFTKSKHNALNFKLLFFNNKIQKYSLNLI